MICKQKTCLQDSSSPFKLSKQHFMNNHLLHQSMKTRGLGK